MSLRFDSSRTASLDGEWDFFPGDHKLTELDEQERSTILVPGLWEAQGHLELDGTAWYRRSFVLDDVDGHWSLRFGAVMDVADVYVNDVLLGSHDSPFTPFELDPGDALVPGENRLAVRVFDPSLDDPEHLSLAHGKQGWANQVFPSRPSLYMTYGGIWQSVTLRRHGPVVVGDVFVNADPDDLVVTVEVDNRAEVAVNTRVGVRTLGVAREIGIEVPGRSRETIEARLGPTTAGHWSPESPVLHDVLVDAHAGGGLSDSRSARFGLRTVRVEGSRILVNGEPYRMKSVLVQGFRAEELYGDGSRDEIVQEVAQAQAMGFNTLRLHIRGFTPTYLDVCDEVGMFLHCDLPVAEPIDHKEMGADTLLARRAVTAIREQVRRDRNHPSIILWSAMNEICDGLHEARYWDGYESFARTLAGAVTKNDPTRPVIENDWVEPGPDRVFVSPILTAHWYGRLHREYLAKIDVAAGALATCGRPFFVTEFGDWGLPEMPLQAQPPFWDTRAVHAAGLAGTLWPGTIGRFVLETQRYQGLSDRLQAEVFRRHDHVGGYCLTELTDVPHELNGVLDLYRRPKRLAAEEMRRANQVVLPILTLDSLVVAAEELVRAELHVANDGPVLQDVEIEARFADAIPLGIEEVVASPLWLGDIEGHRATALGEVRVTAPGVPGSHDLVIRLRSAGRMIAENRYPIHVVAPPGIDVPVRLIGGDLDEVALGSTGAISSAEGPLVIGETALDEAAAVAVRRELDGGRVVVVLAQPRAAAVHFPVPLTIEGIGTAWGSSVFQFTTDSGAIPSLPRRTVLVAEDSTIQAASAIGTIDGQPFPDTAVVIAYKPVPGAVTGTVVGSHGVGAGRLIFCQYRLTERAVTGDVAACSVLADLLRWAAEPKATMVAEPLTKDDGRSLTFFSWTPQVAR
ncbi:MAG: hypothetical protein LC733_07810 [Actinobacteria bacterium]|nr:hypothetical protein [Actinomycetota bacterium]